MLYCTPRGCWYAALLVFSILLLCLLTLTSLSYGYSYAITYLAAVLTLFGTAAHAVYTIDRTYPPSLRPR